MKTMWTDISVKNAGELKDFYSRVFGWTVQEIPMEDENGAYADYAMVDKNGEGVGGVCHKRGANKDLPSQWIVYFTVTNVAESMETCKQLGGKVLKESKNENGDLFYALLEDPSGAVIGIIQEGAYG